MSSHNIDEEQIETLYEKIKIEDWSKKIISDYFLLEEFKHSYINLSDSDNQKAKKALDQAKLYDSSAKKLDNKEIKLVIKNIKFDLKKLRKDMRKIKSKRISSEKRKILGSFTITAQHVTFLFSFFFCPFFDQWLCI